MFDSYRFENVANSFFDHLYHRVLTRFDLLILIISPLDQLAFHWNPISENYNLNSQQMQPPDHMTSQCEKMSAFSSNSVIGV